MSYYNYNRSSGGSSTSVGGLIVLLVIFLILTGVFKSCSRSDAHMVYLSDGYCYHEESHIIYIESTVGRHGTRTTYTPYYDSDGNKARYNVETGEWEVVITDSD